MIPGNMKPIPGFENKMGLLDLPPWEVIGSDAFGPEGQDDQGKVS